MRYFQPLMSLNGMPLTDLNSKLITVLVLWKPAQILTCLDTWVTSAGVRHEFPMTHQMGGRMLTVKQTQNLLYLDKNQEPERDAADGERGC